jgi:uncharacterized protein with von Willebrand factor type A (vWA) domain
MIEDVEGEKNIGLYHIIFMTDGADDYPEKEVNDLKNS